MATLEEARKCPKCQMSGTEGSTKRIRDGKLVQFICKTMNCRWFETSWTVQVRADGSIPDPDVRPRFKDFPERVGNLEIARSMDYVSRLLEAQQKPGGAEV
jgi:hypothetical protein